MSDRTEVQRRHAPVMPGVPSRAEYGSDVILMAKARNRPVENAHIGQRMDNPAVDLAGMAKSFGLEAWGPIEDPADLRPVLERAVRYVSKERKAALVDVFTQFR